MWKVFISPDVQHFLKKSDKQISTRLKKGLKKLKSDNPFRSLEHYEGKGYKLRIGDYRALIEADFSDRKLKVCILDHRKKIYKRKH